MSARRRRNQPDDGFDLPEENGEFAEYETADDPFSGDGSGEEYPEEYPDYPETEYRDYAEYAAAESDGEPEDESPAEYPRSIFRPETRKPNFIVSVLVHTVRVMLIIVLLAGIAGIGALVGIAKGYVDTAPELDLVTLNSQDQNSSFYDRNKSFLTTYRGAENREVVPLNAVPKRLRNAFIAVEDARFYSHNGVDVKRIAGAFIANLTTSGTQGGSTITQQLIKNTLLSSEQSYKRKIQEAYLALQLETRYSKDEILETYLNTIYLGESYYGIKVAAKGFFGKELEELSLRECAMLAGVTNNPYYYNPRRNFYTRSDGETDFAAVTNNRTDYVLRCMYENQFITREEFEAAKNPATADVLQSEPGSDSKGIYDYPHYIEYAVKETVQILLEVNGLPDTAANRVAMENKLRTGGYKIQSVAPGSFRQGFPQPEL